MTSEDTWKLITIPVCLREAALDSPAFRTTMRNLEDQMEQFESWLITYIDSVRRMVTNLKTLQACYSDMVDNCLPKYDCSAVMDSDYTVAAVQLYHDGCEAYWSNVSEKAKDLDSNILAPLSHLHLNTLHEYKSAKREFASAQERYDSALARRAALTKPKETTSQQLDISALNDLKSQYLKSSLHLVEVLAECKFTIDTTLVSSLSNDFISGSYRNDNFKGIFDSIVPAMGRLRKWKDFIINCKSNLTSTFELEEQSLLDSNKAVTSYISLEEKYDSMEQKGQKRFTAQGWLFVKSTDSSGKKQVWMKKWFYLDRNGTFGWLMDDLSKRKIVESEKIGVLLCAVAAAPAEERKYCFTVRTNRFSLLLQASDDNSLKLWLDTFETMKRIAVEQESLASAAFKITTPPIGEISSPICLKPSNPLEASTKKKQRPSSKAVTEISKPPLINVLKAKSDLDVSESIGSNIFAVSPLATSFSQNGADCNSEMLETDRFVTSWGAVNLQNGDGDVYCSQDSEEEPLNPTKKAISSLEKPSLTLRVPSTTDLKDPYPPSLRNDNLQFHSLFPRVKREERVLMVVRGSWISSSLTIPGRLYVTQKCIYFYSLIYGLAMAKSISLKQIQSIKARSVGNSGDLLVQSFNGHRLRISMLLDSPALCKRQMDIILHNLNAEDRVAESRIIKLLQSVDDYQMNGSDIESPTYHSRNVEDDDSLVTKSSDQNGQSSLVLPGGASLSVRDKRIFSKVSEANFSISAKALFHMLCGDRSAMFHHVYYLQGAAAIEIGPWDMKGKEWGRKKMRRKIKYVVQTSYFKMLSKNSSIIDEQVIEMAQEQSCYVLDLRLHPWNIPDACKYELILRLVIKNLGTNKCSLRFWKHIEWKDARILGKLFLWRPAAWAAQIMASNLTSTIENQVSNLGSSLDADNATRIFGPIGLRNTWRFFRAEELADILKLSHGQRKLMIRRNLLHLLVENIFLTAFDIFSLLNPMFRFLRSLVTGASIAYMLLAMLLTTLIIAATRITPIPATTPTPISTGIYIKDIDQLLQSTGMASSLQDNACFNYFNTQLSYNTNEPYVGLQDSIKHIAQQRQSLVLSLRSINRFESAIIWRHFEHFLEQEMLNCQLFTELNNPAIARYCDACASIRA